MTRVDERAQVPPLDSEARARLATALDREEVVAAWIFGSQAAGTAGPLSDVDVAVWLGPAAATGGDGLELRLELTGVAVRALGTGEVDLVVLNDAPPLLAHRALWPRTMILERDHEARVRLETRAVLEYLDTQPLRATLAAGTRDRLAGDRFGRP